MWFTSNPLNTLNLQLNCNEERNLVWTFLFLVSCITRTLKRFLFWENTNYNRFNNVLLLTALGGVSNNPIISKDRISLSIECAMVDIGLWLIPKWKRWQQIQNPECLHLSWTNTNHSSYMDGFNVYVLVSSEYLLWQSARILSIFPNGSNWYWKFL